MLLKLIVIRFSEKCFVFLLMINQYLQTDPEFLSILRILRFRGCILADDIPDFDARYKHIFSRRAKPSGGSSRDRSAQSLERQFEEEFLQQSRKEEFIQAFSNLFHQKHNMQQQWFAHLQNFLVEQSPFRVLTFCAPLLNFREVLKKRLFKPAFAIAWKIIDKTRQSKIIYKFHWVIENLKKTSRQTLHELLELIGSLTRVHDPRRLERLPALVLQNRRGRRAVQLGLEGALLPRAGVLPEEQVALTRNLVGCLVDLYKELGLKESADFLLQTEHGPDRRDNKQSLTSVYEKHEWAIVLENIDKKLEDGAQFSERRISSRLQSREPEKEISEFGARAAFHLKSWDRLEQFTGEMEQGVQKKFYESILSIKDGEFGRAERAIRQFRKLMVKDFGSFDDYMGSYDKIMKMHQIRELEEILLAMKEQAQINRSALYEFILGREQRDKLLRDKKRKLLHSWEDRINLVERNIDYWETIISIRSLYASDLELVRTRRNFGKLCKKLEFRNLFKSTFQFLIDQKKGLTLPAKDAAPRGAQTRSQR